MTESVPQNPHSGTATPGDGNALSALNVHLLNRKFADAECLLNHAVETGVPVDSEMVTDIVEGAAVSRAGWTAPAATKLLAAETALAAKLSPVSAESLRNSSDYQSMSRGRRLFLPALMVLLASGIVLYSTLAFLFSGFAKDISDNIGIANPLSVSTSVCATLHKVPRRMPPCSSAR